MRRDQADAAALVDEEPVEPDEEDDEEDVEEDEADEDESADEEEAAAASFGLDEAELVSDLPEPDLLSVR